EDPDDDAIGVGGGGGGLVQGEFEGHGVSCVSVERMVQAMAACPAACTANGWTAAGASMPGMNESSQVPWGVPYNWPFTARRDAAGTAADDDATGPPILMASPA